VWSACGLL
jgi:hypothetical protein